MTRQNIQGCKKGFVKRDGVIYLPPLVGLGLSGPEMGRHLETEGHEVSDIARQILNSTDYVRCEKDRVYSPAILPGKLFSNGGRTPERARKECDIRNLIHGKNLPTEIGALIRLNFSNEEIKQMGLFWLIAMNEPIKTSDGGPGLLGTRGIDGRSWLSADWGYSGDLLLRESGFVCLASQDPQD